MNLLLLSLLVFGFSRRAWAALPDLQNVTKPSPEPALPVEFDPFTPPVDASTPAANAPVFAEWIRTGAPDDTIVATGDALSSYTTGNDQGKDTEFMVYGQTTTGNGAQKAALIQRLDGIKTAFTLDAALPGWSMYLIWPKNSAGYGYPVAVNRTEAWWLGPKKAEIGQTVAVYGRNLSHDNGTTNAWVYIKKNGTTVASVPATSVNPYRVAFTVPGDLASGDYEVWTHNSHGGHYGWSGPLTLTVFTRQAWTGPVHNVKTYGALGDGVTDDAVAIQAAFTAAGGKAGSTVYFPAGTYMTSKGFTPPNNSRILGDGMNSSFIKLHANYPTNRNYSLLYAESQPRSTVDVQNITLDANGNLKGKSTKLVYLRFSSDVRFSGVRIKALGSNYDPCDFHGSTGLYLGNCEITGRPVFLGNATQVFIVGCDHYGTYDATTAWLGWGVAEMSVMNSTARDYDNTQPWGWSKGRFYAGNGARATSTRGVYFGNNTTFDLTVRPGIPDQNSGEQILFENGLTYYRGTPTAATATTVTFSGLTNSHTGKEAIIVKGKGLGQHRKITGFTNGNITVSPAWNVIPDATSAIIFEVMSEKLVVYDNYFDAKDLTAGTASVGVENYGGAYDWVVDNNIFHQVGIAVVNISIGQEPAQGNPTLDIQPVYWQLNVNNAMKGTALGGLSSLSWYTNSAFDPGLAALGHVYRRNAVSSGNGFEIRTTPYWFSAGKPMDFVVYEHNTGTNLATSINTGSGTFLQSVLAYKNNLNRGTATFSSSKGFNFGSGQTPELQANTWLNYEATYAGTLPGAVLELPVRSFATSRTNPAAIMRVWNSGTAAMSWTASESAAWLALSATSGSAPAEGGNNITLTCDPAALSVGTYSANITVTAGTQTKKVTVRFTL